MRWLLSFFLIAFGHAAAAQERNRIVNLGDSITQAGQYVSYIDGYLFAHMPEMNAEMINVGLSGETVCGLSENATPRADVNKRLDKTLKLLNPKFVTICYGMNDGIYHPFDEKRFEAYKTGMMKVVDACEKTGAKVLLLTPFPFDKVPVAKKTVPLSAMKFGYGTFYENYDPEVLRKYADWIVSLKSDDRKVVDIHQALNDYIASQRKLKPDFTVANDGVHPNGEGHREAARAILKGSFPDKAEQIDAYFLAIESGEKKDWFKNVQKRSKLLADSWREETMGKKPKVSTEDAMKQAAELEAVIRGK